MKKIADDEAVTQISFEEGDNRLRMGAEGGN